MSVRVQFDIDDEHWEEISELMKVLKMDTRKDLFNSALSLLQWAVDETAKGRTVASIDEKASSFKELLMPWMKRVRRHAR